MCNFFFIKKRVIINKDKFNQKETIYQLLGIKNEAGNVKSENDYIQAAQDL
jgi:hypothetical protein